MKHYDPEKVEALLEALEQRADQHNEADEIVTDEFDTLAAAVRSSARAAGEVSEEEIDKLMEKDCYPAGCYHNGSPAFEWNVVKSLIRAALARFAAPRGRVVGGWFATVHDGRFDGVVTKIRVPFSVTEWESVPCLITILDAPPRGEEG